MESLAVPLAALILGMINMVLVVHATRTKAPMDALTATTSLLTVVKGQVEDCRRECARCQADLATVTASLSRCEEEKDRWQQRYHEALSAQGR